MTDIVTSDVPEIGLHRGVEAATYFNWDAVNNSRLSKLKRSALHCRFSLEEEDDQTDAKARGTLAHAAIYEPDRFAAEYAIGPDVKLNTKPGKDEWEAFCAANPGKCHIRGKDGDIILAVRAAVWNDPRASMLLGMQGEHEVSGVWIDEETGLRCKLRADHLAAGEGIIVDLKTTRDASSDRFSKAIFDYGYHRAGAFYRNGLKTIGVATQAFYIIAVETTLPCAVNVFELDSAAIARGWEEIRELLPLYARHQKSGNWPSYGFDLDSGTYQIQTIGLPAWATRKELI